MSFTVSELQSFIKKNSNRIAVLESEYKEISITIKEYEDLKFNLDDDEYLMRKKKKLKCNIADLVKLQSAMKREMQSLINSTITTKLSSRFTTTLDKSKPIVTYPCTESNLGMELQSGIGDVNSNEKGSGARYNSGKPDLSLIPINTLHDEARVWEYGKKKYAAFNWAKGMIWSVPLACALRHLGKWQAGEQNDEESGLSHLAHAMCNLRMLTHYEKFYPEGDDRPNKEYFNA